MPTGKGESTGGTCLKRLSVLTGGEGEQIVAASACTRPALERKPQRRVAWKMSRLRLTYQPQAWRMAGAIRW